MLIITKKKWEIKKNLEKKISKIENTFKNQINITKILGNSNIFAFMGKFHFIYEINIPIYYLAKFNRKESILEFSLALEENNKTFYYCENMIEIIFNDLEKFLNLI